MAVRLPAAKRRAQLVDTALTVFATEGFQATTMDRVAAAAGVTKPVLYQHFPSKRDLFLDLLRDIGLRLSAMVTTAVESAETPRQRVEAGFHAYFRFVDDHSEEFRLLFGEGVRRDEEFATELHRVEAGIAAFIADLVEIDDLTPADKLVLGHGMVGLAEATGRHWISSTRRGDVTGLATRVADLAWSGLRGDRPDPLS